MSESKHKKMEDELAAILAEVGPKKVWRPVDLTNGNGVLCGVGDDCDGLPDVLPGVSFEGKTIADLGSNFGHHTQHVAKRGATLAVGVDLDPRVARGATLFARLAGIVNVRFEGRDIRDVQGPPTYDMAMMIDTLGKGMVRAGLTDSMLQALVDHAKHEILISVTPWYPLKSHLAGDLEALRKHYPARYITNKAFLMQDYVLDWFGDDWEAKVVHRAGDWERAKNLWHLVKK